MTRKDACKARIDNGPGSHKYHISRNLEVFWDRSVNDLLGMTGCISVGSGCVSCRRVQCAAYFAGIFHVVCEHGMEGVHVYWPWSS